jgi:hypothetical protein
MYFYLEVDKTSSISDGILGRWSDVKGIVVTLVKEE